jgi:hypothetical protein
VKTEIFLQTGMDTNMPDGQITAAVAWMKRSAIQNRYASNPGSRYESEAPDLAEFIIGRAFARPGGFIQATQRWCPGRKMAGSIQVGFLR